MSKNDRPERREFLKTAATAGVAGVVGSTGLAAASHDDTYVELSSVNGTGSYEIYVNEEDYDAHGQNLESGDGIEVLSGVTKFEGSVGTTGDADTYYYDGEIIRFELHGSIRADVWNPNLNVDGTITVSGDDGVGYNFCVKNTVTGTSGLESCDSLHDDDQCVNGCIDGAGDEDYYDADGAVLFAENLDSGSLVVEYDQV
jgi:hypothetical protein